MGVLVIAKFAGDTATFRQSLTDLAGEYEQFAERSKTAGGLHHRFGVGDGFVLVIDEWESVEHFQKFFGDPELHAFIGSVGAEAGPPEIIVAEAVSSPDQF